MIISEHAFTPVRVPRTETMQEYRRRLRIFDALLLRYPVLFVFNVERDHLFIQFSFGHRKFFSYGSIVS